MNVNHARKSIGKFDCVFQIETDEMTYFTFDRDNYNLITDLLKTQSVHQSASRSLSEIHISGLNTPKYDKNKDIFKLYTKGDNEGLYHIKECTVQIFIYPDLAGIILANFDKYKRKTALETLDKLLA